MKRAHRTYLLRRPLIVAALVSFLFNGLLGWLLYQSLASASLWKDGIVVGDALLMTFLTALVIGPMMLPHAVQKIRRAQLPPVARYSRSRAWVQRLPVDVRGRTAVVGLAAVIVVVPLVLGLLTALAEPGYSVNQFVLVRAILAATAAGLMAALFTWIGLVDAS